MSLKTTDSKIFELIEAEKTRQQDTICLIPSENYTSSAVLQASGSVLTNKYSEGYPEKRYYAGNKIVDKIEQLCINRAKELFKVKFANVQPYSGSPANMAVYFALLEPGDTIMGMKLSHGGHLTHGHPKITFSGRFYNSVQYAVDPETNLLNYEEIGKLARKVRPKLIIAGYSAYPRIVDWKAFSEIGKSTGAYLLADVAHIAGLIVAGVHPSPVGYADIITTTTHKTLRGPRGAIIMTNNEELASKIDRAVFPGLQGGPHDQQTAAIAVCLAEASKPSFKKYGEQVVANAYKLAKWLMDYGFNLVTGGTDTHLILVDLRNKGISGKEAQDALEQAGITVNKNTIPFDSAPPAAPSGIRLGTPAVTTRGMKESQMEIIAGWIDRVIKNIHDTKTIKRIKGEVKEFLKNFPIK